MSSNHQRWVVHRLCIALKGGTAMTVETILRRKGEGVITIQPNRCITDVLDLLAEEDIGALVVSADGKHLDGIISERNIVRELARSGSVILDWSISALMTREVFTCMGGERIAGIMALMTKRHIRHVPVVADGQLRGIITIGDVVKSRLDEVQAEADTMRTYIQGA
ncbi:MAG: CBS domain-containing protein [Geminicoccaceae bacterium]